MERLTHQTARGLGTRRLFWEDTLRKLVTIVILAGLAASLSAQAPQQPAPPTWESMMYSMWKGTHEKILAMAKDFPEDKLNAKPHPDSRSALDEFRHVTIGLEMATAQLNGTSFNYPERNKADESKPKTRASVVSEMEAALAASLSAVKEKAAPRLVFWIEHQGEHYGKLVTIYRMNDLVPPQTRAIEERRRQQQQQQPAKQ